MTQVVTVHTDFTDLNQMAQGLVGRVNETHVILPGPDPVSVGDWVQFAVTLYDGTPGFAGVGRCVTVVDNGDERLSHQRYDVVIDSLQFDSRGQQIFEHILMLHAGGGDEATPGQASEYTDDQGYADPGAYAEPSGYGEDASAYAEPAVQEQAYAVEDVSAFEDVSADFSGSHAHPAPQAEEDAYEDAEDRDATMMADRAELDAALARSAYEDEHEDALPTAPPPPEPTPAPMRRRDLPLEAVESANGAHPSVAPAPITNGANGISFKYANGLPLPAVPPRPRLDPARRVTPAPRPTRH
jgi:hypothetical protein